MKEMCAKVLSNRKPPYSLKGGLYDALVATGGDMFLATNEEAMEAKVCSSSWKELILNQRRRLLWPV